MHLSENTQEVAAELAGETARAKPARGESKRPDAASFLYGLAFGLAFAAVTVCHILEQRGANVEAPTRYTSIVWVLVTMAWLMFANRRAIRRVQATVELQQRAITAELERFRVAVVLRVAEAREDGFADGYVQATAASNGRHGTVRAIREAGP